MPETAIKRGHPKALYILFFTEMWERFGYYLMVGIFLLYLIDPTGSGGKGLDNANAADIVGSFIALVYLTPFIGGLIADRFLGYRKSIMIGGSLMAIGYLGMSMQGDLAMYISLLFIIVGNGFFKPNISTLLGNIYTEEELKPRKDAAYGIFYMGINIGAFFCNFVAAYLRNYYGWGYAFAAAGVGMILALIIFGLNYKDQHIVSGDVKKPLQKEDMPISKIMTSVFLPAILAGILGWNISAILGNTIFGTKSNDAFMFACVPIIIFYGGLLIRASKEDKRGLGALLAFFSVSIVFWVIYNQNSTALTIWADTYTDRSMSESGVAWTKPFGMLQTVTSDSVQVTKVDQYFAAVLDEKGNTIQTKGVDQYLLNLPKEQWPAKGTEQKLLSPELFQSINPFFIVFFTPLIAVWFFGWLRKRKKEPSTPAKIGIGMVVAGLSSLMMVFAVMSTNIYENKSHMLWLIGTYAIFTIGELLISPIGLSMVSKLAPPRLTALMMGAWFLINSIAGKISGLMATFWDKFPDKKDYFLILFVAAMIAAVILFSMVKWLREVVREKTGMD
ncbi:MAG: peptide MFS transporter [Chitinophagales bacterium]|nr:peptide MFS transporter [Chitinophagales bacterium]